MTFASLNHATGIPLKYANRHGLITGQTGTGKTVSLMRLAESFSRQGVPVFLADVKGDIAALSRSCPVSVLDVFGQTGTPLRVTIAAMGPDLLGRALELTDTQAGCLEIAFAYAAAASIDLVTIADMRRLLVEDMEHDSAYIKAHYGQVSAASIGVIMRALLRLESQGGDRFFSGPQFDVAWLLDMAPFPFAGSGTKPIHGLVSILQADKLLQSPRVYSAFLLWLLSDLYNRLPEIGDMEKPRLVFFFDEAHLIFQDCPAALLRRIEQTVRLIRSKGVGIYFVSQRPDDIPELIRSQLAHTLAHDRSLPVGTAHFQTMTDSGTPAKPVKIKIDPPTCPLGALSDQEAVSFAPIVETPQAKPTGGITAFEIGMLCIVLLGAAAASYGLYIAWNSGTGGKVLAAFVGIAIAGLTKRK